MYDTLSSRHESSRSKSCGTEHRYQGGFCPFVASFCVYLSQYFSLVFWSCLGLNCDVQIAGLLRVRGHKNRRQRKGGEPNSKQCAWQAWHGRGWLEGRWFVLYLESCGWKNDTGTPESHSFSVMQPLFSLAAILFISMSLSIENLFHSPLSWFSLFALHVTVWVHLRSCRYTNMSRWQSPFFLSACLCVN